MFRSACGGVPQGFIIFLSSLSTYYSHKSPLSSVAICYLILISLVETACKLLNEGIHYLVENFQDDIH
jgi:hypothetical protein